MPKTPCENSSISPAIARSMPCTRAIPSPSEITLPTSATSTWTAWLPIWSRMILEISSALISIRFLSEASRPPLLSLFEPIADFGEPPRHAAVVHRAADSSDHAADDRGVDFRRHGDRAASCVGETLLQLLGTLWRQRRGGRHLRPQHVPRLHQPFTVDVEEIRQQRQPAPRGEQQDEFADWCCRLQALEDLPHDGALVSRRHDRIRERSLQIGVRPNQIDKRRELLFGALGIRLFVGYVEQRSRVSRCGGPHAHDVF